MVAILGCGYTGKRVAAELTRSGIDVVTTNRQPVGGAIRLDVEDPESIAAQGRLLTADTRVLYSIPAVNAEVMHMLEPVQRLVYLSTTGVYGKQQIVDFRSEVDPNHPRTVAERMIASHPRALILRPAAIYGPGRGIQASMLAGKFQLSGDGSNFVSRIHVDDLATHAIAALYSDITGAFPVADDEPSESREIAAFCSRLLQVPMPESTETSKLHETRRADRRVDGREIRRLLGIELRFPSYRVGIPDAIERAR